MANKIVEIKDLYVEYKLDDSIVKAVNGVSFSLEKGKTETWKGKESVVITAGNAGAIAFNVNGKDLGKAGDIGEVTEKTFTPEGEKSADSKKDSKK